MDTDLHCIAEAIKLQFTKPKSLAFNDVHLLDNDGYIRYSANVLYEIIGAYVYQNNINVAVKVHYFNCSELVLDFAFKSFKRRLECIIVSKIPEAKGFVEIQPFNQDKGEGIK